MTYYDDGERAQYTRLSGTSMATPHVSGIATLAWSLYPNRSRADIRNAILVSGDTDPSLTDTMISGRRANIEKTIATLTSGTGGDG